VLVGAMIPLAPPIPMGEQQLAFHLFGQVDAGALYILASIWVSAILLTLVERGGLRTGGSILDIASRTLLSALPLLLIVLSLIVAGGAVDPRGEGSLHLGALIALQGRWGGVRWLAMGQPLAFILWLACAPLVSGEAQAHGTLAKHAMSLNLTLLTGALFVGGWQGPWVESTPWLGLLYTGLKVLTITFVGAWAAASLARPALEHRVRTAWTVYTPLSAANLIVTAVVTVLRSS
jgi:NADH-quinone oxidoreductase subunit H